MVTGHSKAMATAAALVLSLVGALSGLGPGVDLL